MSMENLELSLLEAAEAADKKLPPAILSLRKKHYDFCKTLGCPDEEIQESMGLTSMQFRMVKNHKN